MKKKIKYRKGCNIYVYFYKFLFWNINIKKWQIL